MKTLAIIKELRPKKEGYTLELFQLGKPLVTRQFQYLQGAHHYAELEGLTFQMGGSDGPLRGYWEIWQKD